MVSPLLLSLRTAVTAIFVKCKALFATALNHLKDSNLFLNELPGSYFNVRGCDLRRRPPLSTDLDWNFLSALTYPLSPLLGVRVHADSVAARALPGALSPPNVFCFLLHFLFISSELSSYG